jgi:hypothetical protein
MIPRTYELYCEWFLKEYGRPFAASKEEFEAALRAPRSADAGGNAEPSYTYDVDFQADFEFDVAIERREGWGYDN